MIRYPYTGAGYSGWKKALSDYDNNFLLRLFYDMLRIRLIEEEIERRYHQDQMKTPIHLVIGQEATSVGCCAALRREDLLYSSHSIHLCIQTQPYCGAVLLETINTLHLLKNLTLIIWKR